MDTNTNTYGQSQGDMVAQRTVEALRFKQKRTKLIMGIGAVVALVAGLLLYMVVASSLQGGDTGQESSYPQ